jgi:hypothetical protein
VPQGLSFSSTIPGGFEAMTARLARKSDLSYSDLTELTDLVAYGPGGAVAWQGRLERTPRASGDDLSVQPAAVGHQAELDDDKTVQYIYVDQDKSRWGPMSATRRIAMLSENGPGDPTVLADATTGEPGLLLEQQGAWPDTAPPLIDGWYDAGPGDGVGSLYYAWKKGDTLDPTGTDTNWTWAARLCDNDLPATVDTSGNLRAAGPGSGTLDATARRRYAEVYLEYADVAAGDENTAYDLFFTALGVYGPHGITKRGVGTATDAPGLFDTDIIAHAVTRFTTLRTTRAGESTIVGSPYIVPQAAFTDPTTVTEIVRQANRFSLNDWAVWDDKTFWLHNRGGGPSKRWRARVGPAQLSETGPQVDRLYTSVVVQWTDTAGITRTVGPPGSGADVEDAALADADPQNPATLAGLNRRALLSMGTSTPQAAITVGQRFLELSKELDTSGSASLVGHVIDDRGVIHPAWRVRAGDYISFVDSNSTDYRRIVRASYEDSSKTCAIDLDQPPDAMAALLERLSVALQPIGLT